MKNKVRPVFAWSLILFVYLLALLMIFIQFQKVRLETKHEISKQVMAGEVLVVLDYGNGKLRRFKGPIEGEAKVWDAFQQAIATGGINIEIEDNFVPKSIEGFKDGINGKNWALYVNDVKQKFAPFEVSIKPGDKVTFRYE